jgi:hypothetical protein
MTGDQRSEPMAVKIESLEPGVYRVKKSGSSAINLNDIVYALMDYDESNPYMMIVSGRMLQPEFLDMDTDPKIREMVLYELQSNNNPYSPEALQRMCTDRYNDGYTDGSTDTEPQIRDKLMNYIAEYDRSHGTHVAEYVRKREGK